MTAYKRLMNKAENLVAKLQNDITTGKKQICENYGQKQICQFIDKELRAENLTYQEECNIEDVLHKVSNIS